MKIFFFGTPEFAVPTLEKLLNNPNFEVVGIITQPDKRRGRGNQLTPSAVKQVGLAHNLPIWQPKRLKKSPKTLEILKNSGADAFVVVAYGQLLSPEILAMPKLGCINVHGSILPQYRGAAPLQWSLVNGEAETGITTMLMDEGMDTGAMLLKAYTPIQLLDNVDQIAEILAQKGADLLIETLEKLANQGIKSIPQNSDEASHAPLIQKADFAIDWSHSAWQIHNQVRGFFPHCFTQFRGQALKVFATIPLGDRYWPQLPPEFKKLESQAPNLVGLAGQPGELVKILKNFGPVIQTGDGLLLLKEVQLAGKPPRSGWDFVNGMRLSVGEMLGK